MNTAAQTSAATMPGARALVLGLGRTGVSCSRYLRRKGWQVIAADTRENPPGRDALQREIPDLELRCGPLRESLLDEVSQVVISPGLALTEPVAVEAIRRGLPVIGDIELFAREARAPVAAVTGTNGKSTVTTLLTEFALASGRTALAGGNLGRPALELLEEEVPDLYVLELSSFQLETCYSLHSVTATVLNVTPDHLDRYSSLEDYAAAKARVFTNCDVAVINADDDRVGAMICPGQRVLTFSLQDPAADYSLARDPQPAIVRRGEPVLPLASMRMQGLHNVANAMAALAMAEALGLPLGPALEVLTTFKGLAHRSQWVADIGGVSFINDSKGTNVGATVASLRGMGGPLVLIAGGDGKGQDFSELRNACRGKVRHAVLIGQDAPRVESTLAGLCTVERASDMPAAVRAAARAARPGETVLLSPACASLDMFRDYMHRGEAFAAAVQELAQ